MLITNFSSGELSKYLYGRVDLGQYYQAGSKVENFDIIPTGGLKKRKGTKRLAELNAGCRLIPFIVNKNVSFLLEIGIGYIKLWRNGEKLELDGEQLTFVSTEGIPLYSTLEDIREIHYAQNYDELILVHREYKPLLFKWNGGTSFTLGTINFDFKPDIIVSDPYGEYKETEEEYDKETFQTENNYPSTVCYYNGRLWLASTNNHPQKIWASKAPDKNGNRYNQFGSYSKYVTVSKVIKDPDIHVFTGNVQAGVSAITNITQTINVENPSEYYVSSDVFPLGTKVVGINGSIITTDTPATETKDNLTMTIQKWKSKDFADADDYTIEQNETEITQSSDGMFAELASDENDAIMWLSQNQHLVVGTESSEWVIPNTVTATNFGASLQSKHGSDTIQASFIGNACIFFAQGRKAIREYYYSSDSDTFQTNNLAVLNREILEESAITDFDYTTNPNTRIVLVREDGQAVILLYEKTLGIQAWHRLKTNGQIKSCAITRGNDESDLVYFVVERNGKYYLEVLGNDCYLDSYHEYNGELDGDYLYNKTQNKWTPIESIPDDFMTDGDLVYIGYNYTSLFESLPIVENDATGKKRISNLVIRFLDSYFPKIESESRTEIISKAEPFTGQYNIVFPGNSDRDVIFKIIGDVPQNICVLSVNANLS